MANRKIKAELEFGGKDNTGPAFRSVATRMGQIERQMSTFNKTAGRFEKQIASINRQTSGFQRAADGIGRAGSVIGKGLAVFGAYQVGSKVTGAIKDFGELERQMTRIGITAGSSTEETKTAFEQVQKLTKDLKFDSIQPGIEALDTLVSSGKSLEEAMAFLPSMLMTTQASGAAAADIANTGLKAADALGLKANEMQRAFDIMVTGGKEGQFELKDMAQYIPDLANSFASLGYKGEDGLKKLVAILQTIREDTGSASGAATYAGNIFGKIYSAETSSKFAKMGIDLRSEMEKSKKAGEDTISAFVRLSNQAIGGDLSKLPLLFSDEQFRLGMQSLMTSPESMKKFETAMNSTKIDGTVFRDFQRVAEDTKASVDSLSNSMSRLYSSAGEALTQGGGKEAADWLSGQLDYASAVNRGLEKNGTHGFWARTGFGITSSQLEKDQMAIKGGYNDPKFVEDVAKRQAEHDDKLAASETKKTDRYRPKPQAQVETPITREDVKNALKIKMNSGASYAEREANSPGTFKGIVDWLNGAGNTGPVPNKWDRGRASVDTSGVLAVTDGGKEAGKAIEDSAGSVKAAGADAGDQIKSAGAIAGQSIRQGGADAAALIRAAMQSPQAGSAPANAGIAGSRARGVNADTGRTMPDTVFSPGGN